MKKKLGIEIICGFLLILGITGCTTQNQNSVNDVINDAKKDIFAITAQSFVNDIRYQFVNGKYETPQEGECIVALLSAYEDDTDDSMKKSVAGVSYDEDLSFVIIYNNDGKYQYYVQLVDKHKNGISLENESKITGDMVSVGGKEVTYRKLPKKNEHDVKLGDSKDTCDVVIEINR